MCGKFQSHSVSLSKIRRGGGGSFTHTKRKPGQKILIEIGLR